MRSVTRTSSKRFQAVPEDNVGDDVRQHAFHAFFWEVSRRQEVKCEPLSICYGDTRHFLGLLLSCQLQEAIFSKKFIYMYPAVAVGRLPQVPYCTAAVPAKELRLIEAIFVTNVTA
jgi:hypothetical protein